jgi:hypothetical protein
MSAPVLIAKFSNATAFLDAYHGEINTGGLLVRDVILKCAEAMSECVLRVEVGGQVVEVAARVAAVTVGVGTAVLFVPPPAALHALATSLLAPAPVLLPVENTAQRVRDMSLPQKMRLAVAGNREVRAILMQDPNPALQVMVLGNKALGMDEVQAAARMEGLSADAARTIAASDAWRRNPGVAAALLANPATPLEVAVSIADRLPAHEARIMTGAAQLRAPVAEALRRRQAG